MLALAACTTDPTTVGTPTGPVDVSNAVALDPAGTLEGWWFEHIGTDLAFVGPELLVGAPSRGGDVNEAPDDLAQITASGIVGFPNDLLDLNDEAWADPYLGTNGAANGFGTGVAAPGDVTGDGVPDAAVAEDPARGYDPLVGRWAVFAGPDYVTSIPLTTFPTWGHAAPCGDLDGNGVAELCTTDGVVFGPVAEDAEPGLSWVVDDARITGADLDGDGAIELVVSDADTSAVYRLAGIGAAGAVDLPTFATDVWSGPDGRATALAAGDLDGDGAEDLVVGWTGTAGAEVRVGLPAGGGDLAAARTTLRVPADDLAIGDFDGDGQDDLAVGGGAQVAVWLGPLPAGELGVADAAAQYLGTVYPDDGFGRALAAADTDGDGRAELAIGAPYELAEPNEFDSPEYDGAGRVWWLPGAGLP